MSEDIEKYFSELEANILKFARKYKELQEKYQQASEEVLEWRTKYEEERHKCIKLEEEQKNIKLFSAISGNPEHNRLMKNHINRLIKEVDYCIAQLQNSGL